jgi:hypothetical protein
VNAGHAEHTNGLHLKTRGKTMPTKTNTAKRILSIKVVKRVDECPDTSYLGEYSNTAESEYAIDRYHSEDCQSVSETAKQAIEKLERIIQYLNSERLRAGDDPQSTDWESLDEALDILIALQDDLADCDCSGHQVSSREYRYFNPPVENYKGESPEDVRK